MEAVASGTRLMLENIWSVCPANSASSVFLMVSHGIGAVLSRHFWNSSTYSSGNSVGEEAMNWPSLMYVAPSFSKRDLKTACNTKCEHVEIRVFGEMLTGYTLMGTLPLLAIHL